MSRVVPSNRLRMLPVRRPATTRLLGPSPPRFPAAGAVRTIQRPAYRLPRRLKQDVSAVRGSSHDTAAFEVPQDAVTLLLAHKMLGIGAFRRFLAKIQCMGIRNFGDSRFDADELTAGARQAYAAVTSAAFGKEWERDHQLLRQLVSENVADRMIAAASHNLATSVTLHHMMHAEIIGARMTTDPTDPDAADSNGRPFPTRMFFDVRFLACESTFNTGVHDHCPLLAPLRAAANSSDSILSCRQRLAKKATYRFLRLPGGLRVT